MVRLYWTAVFVLVAVVAFARSKGTEDPPAPVAVQVFKPAIKPGLQAIGSIGCYAASCHGGNDHTALMEPASALTWKNSATIFNASDPHRKAYDVLESPVGNRIAKYLAKVSGAPFLKASNDERCLACHVNPSVASESLAKEHQHLRGDGISCEACHGDAANWQDSHMTRSGGKNHPDFRDLNDLTIRADNCVGCHVGAPASEGFPLRDMNHDMIAGGHPRLEFDFTAHVARMPRHWYEQDKIHTVKDSLFKRLEQAWECGDRTMINARLDLLKDRVERHLNGTKLSPWPEFSEASCMACHHGLLDGRAVKGELSIARWNAPWSELIPQVRTLLDASAKPDPIAIRKLLQSRPALSNIARLRERLAKLPAHTVGDADEALAAAHVLAASAQLLKIAKADKDRDDRIANRLTELFSQIDKNTLVLDRFNEEVAKLAKELLAALPRSD